MRARLQLAQLLAVVGDVAEKARNHGSRSRGICLRRVPENGSYDDPLQAPIMPSEEGPRVGRVDSLFCGDRTLQGALCTKATVGERIGAEGCERGCSLDHPEARPAHSLQNTLLPSQLRLDALEAAARVAYPAKAIAERVTSRSDDGGLGGGIEKGDQLDDGIGASTERLPLPLGVRAPLPGTQLSEPEFKGGGERRHLMRLPLAHEIAWQPMDAGVIGRRTAWGALHYDERVVGDESATVAKGVPHRSPCPAAALEARHEDVVECGGPFWRTIGEAVGPMGSGKLPLGMIETQVDDAHHRGAIAGLASARNGFKFVVRCRRAPVAAPPAGIRRDIEIASGEAPTRLHRMAYDRLERLRLPVALLRPVRGHEAHGRGGGGVSAVLEVDHDGHRHRVNLWLAARRGLALEPREQQPARRTRGSIGALAGGRPARVELMSVARLAEPGSKAPRVLGVAARAADLVQDDVRRRVRAAQKRVEHVVARGGGGLLPIRSALAVAAPPASRVP